MDKMSTTKDIWETTGEIWKWTAQMMFYLMVICFQMDNGSMWENPLFRKLDAGVRKGEVTMATKKKSVVFIELFFQLFCGFKKFFLSSFPHHSLIRHYLFSAPCPVKEGPLPPPLPQGTEALPHTSQTMSANRASLNR